MQQNKQHPSENKTQYYCDQRVVLVDWAQGGRFARWVPRGSEGVVKAVEPVVIRCRIDDEWQDRFVFGVVVEWDICPGEFFVMSEYEIAPAEYGAAA